MKYTNTELEEKANSLLNNVLLEMFAQNNKMIGKHPSKLSHEIGIDYFYEIRDRTTGESLNVVFNQNKGTENINIIKGKANPEKGNISFQLKLRHAKYFLNELNKPLFFTVCDLKLMKVYWYWIQLDNSIKERIETQLKTNKRTLQIFIPIANELNLNNFDKFYKELEKSDRIQTHKFLKSKLLNDDEYDFEEIENSELHIIDKIAQSIKKFDGLTIIPKHVLRRMYPFKGTKDKTYFFNETLHTDNEQFYNLFEALEKQDNNIRVKEEFGESISILNFEDKLKDIIDFLQSNLIQHLKWNGKGHKERICAHNLYDYDNTCDCERCNYNKLNFKKAANLLSKRKEDDDSIVKFRQAYTYYLLGDLKNAFLLYKEVTQETKNKDNSILNILCKYNLINLKNLIKNNYFEADRNEILIELKKINFVYDEILIEHNYYKHVFDWIKENQFINNSIWEIDRQFTEIQNHHRKDKNGGYFRGQQANSLKFEFLRVSFFIEYNLIIYDVFNEFQILVHKSLESMFALYNIYNPDSTKYDKFEFTFLYNWLMHGDSTKVNRLLLKYDIQQIELNDELLVFNRFNDNLDNLIISIKRIKENKENYLFRDKVKNIIQNFAYILSRIKMRKTNFNLLLKKYIALITLLEDDYLVSLIKFETLFHYRNDINLTNTKKILKLLSDYELFDTQSYNKGFEYYLTIQDFEKKDNRLVEIFSKIGTSLNQETIESDFYSNFSKYQNVLEVSELKKEIKKVIQKAAIKRLEDNFDSKYYYRLSIYDIIPFHQEFFDKFFNSIKDLTNKPTGHELITGATQRKNYDLNNLINLSYKYNILFTSRMKKLSKYAHESDYYDWLMDIEGFDYLKFNHYWLLEYKTKYYFEEFKKHKKLKEEVKSALDKNYIEGVAKIYINHF
ncbi:hypothetical protein A9Q86_02175 [Flavobacteriales bacterium 33_180_T64]|nr:hypothetical protein A9Q86_02175 [Flavobacteriales bacterium 33_180_T64]